MRSCIPSDLKGGPFAVADARDAGVSWEGLQTRNWRRMSRGQYAWTGLRNDVELTLRAVEKRLPAQSAFSGRTAAWIHGLDLPPCEPIEVTIPRELSIRTRAGVKLTRAALPTSDQTTHRGFRVTTPLRTVRDLGSRSDLVESTVAVDMALRARLTTVTALGRYIDNNVGTKGIKRLRRSVALADARSESPMETRLRLELIRGRLPSPDLQVDLHDRSGRFLGRADLYYHDLRLVIEFDGQKHRERLTSDLRRQNALIEAGYQVLRFTAPDLLVKGAVAAHVRKTRNSLLHRLG